ncbi:hypothetical protein SynA18461_01326 [Synechococcus sp. A18-46.1]|nr:hypothetical protein SynA18461_01326 [Synechococcus sp. A18-46.1]
MHKVLTRAATAAVSAVLHAALREIPFSATKNPVNDGALKLW